MTTSYLVLFDADRIHEYVFATGRLKEIRGASEQVRRLTEPEPIREMSGLDDWQAAAGEGLIYAGGAAGALQFRDEQQAHTFCQKLERAYRHATRGIASITAVVEQVEEAQDDMPAAAQAAAQTRAARALARRKASRPQSLPPAAGGVLRFCSSDRLVPASVLAPDPDDANARFFSEATARKRLLSFQYRKRLPTEPFWEVFEATLQTLPDYDSERLTVWRQACQADQDLGSIGALAEARGYVAMIHIDGDGIGQVIRKVVQTYGFEGFYRFSKALRNAAMKATGQALAYAYCDHPLPKVPDADTGELTRCLPFEVITIGGDDVVLICTGERGLTVAVDLAHRFGDLVREAFKDFDSGGLLEQTPPSASAGVVIAHASLPIVVLARRAEELLKSAKDRDRPAGVGALDFQIVTTPSLDAIHDLRKQEYTAGADVALTRRPYTLAEAGKLLDHAIKLTPQLPNSKRADLYHACQGDRILATLNVLAVHMRLGQNARLGLLKALNDLGGIACYPFADRDERGTYRTALLDLLEAIEFIPERAP
jgi:Cas10/Cmr2, second palm domain